MREKIAEFLLEIGAVSLNPEQPYTWTSGLHSPIYCDNRLTISYPEIRKEIACGLADAIRDAFPEVEVIAGTATAGIPHAAWVSEILGLPMCYIRSSTKAHGKKSRIEGKVLPGQKVVIIEDLISTGGSIISASEAVREEGGVVLGAAAIFTYGLEKGEVNLAEAGLEAITLTDFQTLAQTAYASGKIGEAGMKTLLDWQLDPVVWSERSGMCK